MKTIEYLARGRRKSETCKIVGISRSTLDNWLRDFEFKDALTEATDTFTKEVSKQRTREYRALASAITHEIEKKLDANALATYSLDELVKMLGQVSSLTKQEQEQKTSVALGNVTQNNIQIGGEVAHKLENTNQEFMHKFGQLLVDLDPSMVQEVAEVRVKSENELKNKK